MYKSNSSIPLATAYVIAIAAFSYIFLPPLWLFLHSIESGMNWIDHLYPQKQSRQPFHDNPLLIYTHMYANTIALGLHFCLLSWHPPMVSKRFHRRIAWTYAVFVTTGTLASIFYASRQSYGSDGGKAGTVAFGVMALATLSTLATALYYIYVRRDGTLHREWALRNFAILFGNGVFFRVLANTYLVLMKRWGADFYASWCQMIYLAWILPLFAAEWYLSRKRSRQRTERQDEAKAFK